MLLDETKTIASQILSSNLVTQLPKIFEEANKTNCSYEELFNKIIMIEWNRREVNRFEKRIKDADLPYIKTIEQLDLKRISGISQSQMDILINLNWIDNHFNLLLFGKPGIGKTHITLGLAFEAIKKEKKVVFISMSDLIKTLKTELILRKSVITLNKIKKADLIIIDDVMYFGNNNEEATLIFGLFSSLYEKASIIITSNRNQDQWCEKINNEDLSVAILDRLLHHSEIIYLDGISYRLEHRNTIFND